MAKLTPNNSRSAQMITRAAGKGMLIAEDEKPADAQNDASSDASIPDGPRFDSLVSYPEATPDAVDTSSDDSDDVDRKLAAIPPEPGVYLLKDKAGKVLYVGKAKSLR